MTRWNHNWSCWYCRSMMFNWKFPFTKEHKEWVVVIENTHEHSSADFEENTGNHMEARSVSEFKFSFEVDNFWWRMKDICVLHMHKRFEIECTYLDKNFKRNEVNDAFLNFLLVDQESDTNDFSCKSN